MRAIVMHAAHHAVTPASIHHIAKQRPSKHRPAEPPKPAKSHALKHVVVLLVHRREGIVATEECIEDAECILA